MSVSGISSSTAATASAQAVQQQPVKAEPKAVSADTVAISKQAQQLLADGDTRAQELSESGAEKASETRVGKA